MPFETHFQIHDLKEVLDYFAKGFQPKDGRPRNVISWDTYLDPAREKVIFRLLVEEPEDRGPG